MEFLQNIPLLQKILTALFLHSYYIGLPNVELKSIEVQVPDKNKNTSPRLSYWLQL